MGRNLTAKQKALLKKWYKEKEPTKESKMLFGKVNPLRSVNELDYEKWVTLEKMNDTEILYQEVNRFLHDLRMK